jgi:hypothetical protein
VYKARRTGFRTNSPHGFSFGDNIATTEKQLLETTIEALQVLRFWWYTIKVDIERHAPTGHGKNES